MISDNFLAECCPEGRGVPAAVLQVLVQQLQRQPRALQQLSVARYEPVAGPAHPSHLHGNTTVN